MDNTWRKLTYIWVAIFASLLMTACSGGSGSKRSKANRTESSTPLRQTGGEAGRGIPHVGADAEERNDETSEGERRKPVVTESVVVEETCTNCVTAPGKLPSLHIDEAEYLLKQEQYGPHYPLHTGTTTQTIVKEEKVTVQGSAQDPVLPYIDFNGDNDNIMQNIRAAAANNPSQIQASSSRLAKAIRRVELDVFEDGKVFLEFALCLEFKNGNCVEGAYLNEVMKGSLNEAGEALLTQTDSGEYKFTAKVLCLDIRATCEVAYIQLNQLSAGKVAARAHIAHRFGPLDLTILDERIGRYEKSENKNFKDLVQLFIDTSQENGKGASELNLRTWSVAHGASFFNVLLMGPREERDTQVDVLRIWGPLIEVTLDEAPYGMRSEGYLLNLNDGTADESVTTLADKVLAVGLAEALGNGSVVLLVRAAGEPVDETRIRLTSLRKHTIDPAKRSILAGMGASDEFIAAASTGPHPPAVASPGLQQERRTSGPVVRVEETITETVTHGGGSAVAPAQPQVAAPSVRRSAAPIMGRAPEKASRGLMVATEEVTYIEEGLGGHPKPYEGWFKQCLERKSADECRRIRAEGRPIVTYPPQTSEVQMDVEAGKDGVYTEVCNDYPDNDPENRAFQKKPWDTDKSNCRKVRVDDDVEREWPRNWGNRDH